MSPNFLLEKLSEAKIKKQIHKYCQSMTTTGQRLNSFEHALKRPDAYIGSTQTTKRSRWIVTTEGQVKFEEISYNPGLRNIIGEIGANVVDNKWRSDHTLVSPDMKRVDIILDQSDGSIEFVNDGHYIVVEKAKFPYKDHRTGKITEDVMYPAEVFFGDMLAGTNFEDIEHYTAGKNGMGSKATNVFSTKFTVDHSDGTKRFVQVYTENGSKRSEPRITSCKKKPYTSIKFVPDYKRFQYPGLDDDLISILKYYAHEISAAINGVSVHFTVKNTEGTTTKQIISVKDMVKFAKLHYPGKPTQYFHLKNETNGDEVVIIETDMKTAETLDSIPEEQPEPEHRAFVNGIICDEGGTHLDAWRDVVVGKLVKAFNARKGKKDLPKASAKMMNPFLFVVVNCRVKSPGFNHQTKEKMTSTYTGAVAPALVNVDKMLKWEFVSKLEEKLMAKIDRTISKKENSGRIKLGSKLKDAGWAGKARREETIMYICEGQSATDLPIRGASVTEHGHDIYGVYAIRGKFMNVVGHTKQDIEKNEEIQVLKKVLGLTSGTNYLVDDNFKKLRYGRVCILTDADDDGIHIRGLLLNFFWRMYPSLCKRGYVSAKLSGSCLQCLSTPVVKVTKG
jgi:DNA topoisomerase-2